MKSEKRKSVSPSSVPAQGESELARADFYESLCSAEASSRSWAAETDDLGYKLDEILARLLKASAGATGTGAPAAKLEAATVATHHDPTAQVKTTQGGDACGQEKWGLSRVRRVVIRRKITRDEE